MSNTIDQYREAKAAYQKLHSQAKKELVARFHQLASELLLIQRELKDDFGYKISLPLKGKVPRAVNGARTKKAVAPEPPPNPKVAVLEKRLAAEKMKLEKASASGKPEKLIRDRIYEIEDELRLNRDS